MELIITSLIALLLSHITLPGWRIFALQINLTDKPNARKKHKGEIPVVGGIGVFLAGLLCIVFGLNEAWQSSVAQPMLTGAAILLLVGAIDDRYEIKASIKLLIQIMVSGMMVWHGLVIESLHGILGIYELPRHLDSILTVIVIVGTINAFNLIDGIDGLAGGFFILVFMFFGGLAWWFELNGLAVILFAFGSALVAFLRQNLSRNKIFLGDAGSLSLGFILVVAGILLFNHSAVSSQIPNDLAGKTVLGLLLLPVLDSFRVYAERLFSGLSPFKADRRHIHHLYLNLGLSHRKSTAMILLTSLGMTGILWGSVALYTITSGILLSTAFFFITIKLVLLGNHVFKWTHQIRTMEKI